MTDTLITFGTAKLAKEKNFKIRCCSLYNGLRNNEIVEMTYKNGLEGWYSAPTQSLLQKWLREEHGVLIGLYPFKDHASDSNDPCVWKTTHTKQEEYKTYEEALEAGLQEALKLV